jgi:hypothetical protein
MQSRDNHFGRFTAPAFRVFAKHSSSPSLRQLTRSDTLSQADILSQEPQLIQYPLPPTLQDQFNHSIPIGQRRRLTANGRIANAPARPLCYLRTPVRRGAHDTALRISQQ